MIKDLIEEKEKRLLEISLEYKQIERDLLKLYRQKTDEQIEKIDNDLCKCGHIRKEHGKSFSINYSDGGCGVKKCKCINYLQIK